MNPPSHFIRPAPAPVRAGFVVAGTLLPETVARFISGRMFKPRRNARAHDWKIVANARPVKVPHRGQFVSAYVWRTQGPMILLVHGWEGWISDWSALIPALLQAGFSVAAIELPAHGKSPLSETDVHDIADALHGFMDAAGGLHAVIAHSLGAAAVVKCLSERPRKPARMALIAPGGELAAELARLAGSLALPSRCIAQVRRNLEQQYGVPLEQCSARRFAATLNLPGIVLHDRQDRIVPFSEGQALARQLRGARLIATEGLGHQRILQDAPVLGLLTDFCLERRPAAAPLLPAAVAVT